MKALPDGLDLLLAWRLRLANKHVSLLLSAAGDSQELVKLKHAALAARPSFATLVEDRVARVVHAFLFLTGNGAIVRSPASFPTARSIGRNFQVWVVRLWLLNNGLCGGCAGSRNGGGNGRALGDGLHPGDGRCCCWRFFGGLFRLGNWCVVDFGVFARGAGRDGEEFLKGQNAGFAAFPACVVRLGLACCIVIGRIE